MSDLLARSFASPGRPPGRAGLRRFTWLLLAAGSIGAIGHAAPPPAPDAPDGGAQAAQQAGTTPAEPEDLEPVQKLEAFEVSATRVRASEAEGARPMEQYDPTQIEESGAFTVEEFFETLPPGDEDEEQLVLIDGVPAYLDPAMLALGMIEGIDVALEGSMPQHGAQADGRVINIRLKKEFTGAELAARTTHSFAGGGARREAKLSGGVARGRYRLMFSLNHQESEGLPATARWFSRDQDHRARGGRDLRLGWGSAPVVEAVDGALDTFGDRAVALVPEGAVTTPPAAGFEPPNPALGAGAEGQRRFDTAGYRWLSTPLQRTGGSLQFTTTFGPRLSVTFSASHRRTEAERRDAPPVTAASDDAVVPAAFSPFGEAVRVGLVHVGFGPTRQHSTRERSDTGVMLQGGWGESWKWNGGVGYRRDQTTDVATDLDEERLGLALADPDPAQRFNPFVDAGADANAHLYPALTVERTRQRVAEHVRVDFGTTGNVFRAPGGPARLSFRGNYSDRAWERRTVEAPDRLRDEDEDRLSSYAVSAGLTVPLVAADRPRTALRRLEAEISGQYEEDEDGGHEREAEVGLLWSPAAWLLLRAEAENESESPPGRVEARPESLIGATLIDPRRDFEVASDVREFARDVLDVAPERSEELSFGATIEPPFVEGLQFKVDYDDRRRRQLFRDEFDSQEVIYNEAAFPGRVIRAEPTADDLAAGRPGRILAVDTTGGNAGEASSRDVDLSVDYRTPEGRFGRFRVTAHARHLIDIRYELLPGVPFVNDGGGRFNPPDWRFRGTASWTWRAWTVSLRADHTGSITTGIVEEDLPAYTELDLNIGYRWQQPVWGRFGRGLRVMIGIDNLFDREPPLADTLNGYRGGSPLGRSVRLSVNLPL